MSRYLCLKDVSGTDTDGRTPVVYRRNQVCELTSAQVASLGAANFRLENNTLLNTQTVTYTGGATSTTGTAPCSPTRDTAGEGAGTSNGS